MAAAPAQTPSVVFHSGVADKLAHAMRLLRRMQVHGLKVVVRGEPPLLARLDQALWTDPPGDFLPHLRWPAGQPAPVPALARRTPVWLVEADGAGPAEALLLNLGPAWAGQAEHSPRVVEVVGTEPAERDAGRQRWRRHEAAGRAPQHHRFDGGG
ncbi:DNA polymerase III subunit chi [Aquabacterium sp. J223]|uniref:DNA polymerase III subunit chi n=1 Tax=Aquabacterium sp. J223 TaxID=2898431 RepID=UPI0021ADA2A2|nr:DNA polymerase III subunit chi [Aquabacterium sp. J223]UUX94818.1 DNA polymerase III subunit chi [Aquabacterium sp. J223]